MNKLTCKFIRTTGIVIISAIILGGWFIYLSPIFFDNLFPGSYFMHLMEYEYSYLAYILLFILSTIGLSKIVQLLDWKPPLVAMEAEFDNICNTALTICYTNKALTGISYDRFFTFFFNVNKKTKKALVEVESGNVNKDQIIKLYDSIKNENASFGIFVCFEEYVTDGMRRKAKEFGKYEFEKNAGMKTYYDIIQILTVEDILEGKKPNVPVSLEGKKPNVFVSRIEWQFNHD